MSESIRVHASVGSGMPNPTHVNTASLLKAATRTSGMIVMLAGSVYSKQNTTVHQLHMFSLAMIKHSQSISK